MLNVFVISSDKRVDSLIEYFQPFFKTKIRCASDFDNGLKEVFENRPSVVFIQSTIGTVSGETVSRHIKSLLGSASPRIIFMGDVDDSSRKGTSWCDDWIRFSDSEQQMRQAFAELISRYFPDDWREVHREMEKATSGSDEDLVESDETGEQTDAEDVSPYVGNADYRSGASEKTPDNSRSVRNSERGSDNLAPDREISAEEAFPAYQNLYGDPLLESIAAEPKRHFAGKFFAILILLALAGSGIYFWMARKGDNTSPASSPPGAARSESVSPPVPPPVKIQRGIKGLPSFVQSEWRDVPYSSQHPGWERYVSPEADFRIYRINDTIKALQGISRGQDGFSKAYLEQILTRLGISGPLPNGRETSENGMVVKTFVLPGVAELVTYCKPGNAQITAFVLEFS